MSSLNIHLRFGMQKRIDRVDMSVRFECRRTQINVRINRINYFGNPSEERGVERKTVCYRRIYLHNIAFLLV